VRRAAVSLVGVALLATAAGCGGDEAELSALCLEGPEPVERALAAAPAPVRLADGTPLSACVRDAQTDADLQSFGLTATRVADALAAEADRADPAVRLGYLIGAAQRGAAQTQGIQADLVRRLRASGRRVPDRLLPALERGIRAGERTG
jgi:hypothetical protein